MCGLGSGLFAYERLDVRSDVLMRSAHEWGFEAVALYKRKIKAEMVIHIDKDCQPTPP